MRWFPAINFIEARLAQAHVFDQLHESITKLNQTPNQDNLLKVTQILDSLYVQHNLSLTNCNLNILNIAYKNYRSYATSVVIFNYLNLGERRLTYKTCEFDPSDFYREPVKLDEGNSSSSNSSSKSRNYSYYDFDSDYDDDDDYDDDYDDYDDEDKYEEMGEPYWQLENQLTSDDELKLFAITDQELKDNLSFNNDDYGRLCQIFCFEAYALQYTYDYFLEEKSFNSHWTETTFCDDRARSCLFKYDRFYYDAQLFETSNKSQTVAQWVQNQETASEQAFPTFKLNESAKLCYFQPMENSKDTFSWIKLCDLFIVHSCLVAFRRELYANITSFEVFKDFGTNQIDFNLDHFNQLREDAINAADNFNALYAQSLSCKASDPSLLFELSSACIMLFARISRFMDNLEYALYDLLEYEADINEDLNWNITCNFFNFYHTYLEMLKAFSNLTKNCVNALLPQDTSEISIAFSNLAQTYEQEVAQLPIRLYEACAPYSSCFEKIEDIQVKSFDFKNMLQNVFAYRHSLLNNHLPIVATACINDSCNIEYKDELQGLDFIEILHKVQILTNLRPLTYLDSFSLSMSTDDSVMVANCMTLAVDNINQLFIRVLKHLGPTKNYLAFDNWYKEDQELANLIYPKYQEILANENFKALITSHKKCFSLLKLIIEQIGLDGVSNDVLAKEPYYASLQSSITADFNELASEIAIDKENGPLGAALLLLAGELARMSSALINLQEHLPNEIVAIIDSNRVALADADSYGFKCSLHLMNLANYFLKVVMLKQLGQVDLANSLKDVILLQNYEALKRIAIDCYCYTNYETKEGFIKYMGYMTCIPAIVSNRFMKYMGDKNFKQATASIGQDSLLGLKAIKHLFALNAQEQDSNELNKYLNHPLLTSDLYEYLLAKSIAFINYGTMAVATELTTYICHTKTQKELKQHLDSINLVINAIKYIKQTKNIDSLPSTLSLLMSDPHKFQASVQELLELVCVLDATIKLLAPVSENCLSLNDNQVISPLINLLKDLLTNPSAVLASIDLNQDLDVAITEECSLFAQDSSYYQAFNGNRFNFICQNYDLKASADTQVQIFGNDLQEILDPSFLLGKLINKSTNFANKAVLNLIQKETSVLSQEELITGLGCDLTSLETSNTPDQDLNASLITEVLQHVALSKANTFKPKMLEAPSADKSQETAVETVADGAETKAKAKAKAPAKAKKDPAKKATAKADSEELESSKAKDPTKAKAKAKSASSKTKAAKADSLADKPQEAAVETVKAAAKAKSTSSKAK